MLLAAQAYDWNNVTVKGTGFIDGIVFSPAEQGLAYMNTDMGGAYRWDNSASKWIPLTDWITNNDPQWGIKYNGAETLAADPTDASRVYMGLGTYFGGNGAILRSSDQGRTWLRTNVPFGMNGNGNGRNAGQRMMVDPNSSNILFYATRRNGIWKSTDYGATWNQLSGYTFTTDSSGAGQDVGTDWLLVDKSSGTPGSPSQVIYAGAATTGNSKIWRSSDGGATWTAIAGQPTGSTLYTVRGALTPDGSTLYITYGVGDVGIGPTGQSNGYVYKITNPKTATPTWAALTIDSPHGQGGWSGITIDPNNPNTLFVSTIDHWWPTGDNIYRSTNGGSTWTALNPDSHRDDSSSGWSSSVGIHWLGDVQIDPFNANNVMFTTGFGIFMSSNAMAATPTWAFFNDGFEQSAVSELVSPNAGAVNLFSAIGDRDGFRHADFAVSPARLGQSQGLATGTNNDIDVAWNDPNYIVRATYTSPYVQYSNDNGVTWAWMSSTGVTATTGGDNLAISADGTKVVWEQGGTARVIYATRSGSTWSSWSAPASNQPADGSKVVADLVSPTTFYAYVGTTLSRSTDGGANWTVMTSSAPGSGQAIRAVPGNSGHLLLSTGGSGLWRSINGGSTWTRINSSAVSQAYELGVGKAAPGQSYPAMFVMGVVNGISGFFRSDDQGATWTMISDLAHEYGDVTTIQGDPRVYGRLYVGTNGRGILYADIHTPQTSLPSGWSTQDIGAVGSIGAAGSPTSGAWELTGGGAGITGTADAFRFAYQSFTGDCSITARVMGVPNDSPANHNALAGVMIRNGLSANSAEALMAMSPGSVNGAVFKYRSTTGSGTSSAGAPGVWNPYWVQLTRVGNVFTAYRSADGITWTQVGPPQTIVMGADVLVGLATTASDNNQVNTSSFQNVSITGVVPPLLDYNGNGSVDAADYVVWRKTLGSTTNLQANGDNTGASAGIIDQADYSVWRTNFGNTAAAAGSSSAQSPVNADAQSVVTGGATRALSSAPVDAAMAENMAPAVPLASPYSTSGFPIVKRALARSGRDHSLLDSDALLALANGRPPDPQTLRPTQPTGDRRDYEAHDADAIDKVFAAGNLWADVARSMHCGVLPLADRRR